MWPVLIVLGQPPVQVSLQVLEPMIQLLAERHTVKLILDGAMKTLANAVGLRVISFCPGVLNVVNGQVELVIMSLRLSTILGSSVGQNTDQAHILFCKERQHSIIE